MSTVYVLMVWDPKIRRYVELNRWNNEHWATVSFGKSYNRHVTRKLVRITTETVAAAKGVRRW